MKKTILITAAVLLGLTASCTYNTNTSYSSKSECVPIVRPAPVIVRPVVRPVYIEPVVEPIRVSIRSYSFHPVIVPPRSYNYLYIE
jgi:hypothetical protein